MTLFPWLANANRVFTFVLIFQFALALAIAAMTDTWLEAIILGGLILAFPLFAIKAFPALPLTRYSVGIALQLMTALHIQQASGLTELHFEVFVVLAFLSIYRDSRVVLISTLTVAVHHILFFVLQSGGSSIYIFEEGRVTFGILAIHAGFAVVEGALLMYIAKIADKEAKTGYYVTNSIRKILSQQGRFDLTLEIPDSSEELKNFKRLIGSFKELISDAKQTSVVNANLSEEVFQRTEQICQLVNKNTQQVDSIATAIEEMSVTNDNVWERASDAGILSTNASENISSAKQIIDNVNQDIQQLNNELNDTSETISRLSTMCNDIDSAMSQIKSISEQTNLLALNAAIESARAGEHGRGFAVVADEVRQLSIRTGENAEEITKITSLLISEAAASVEKVNGCVQRVEQSVLLSADAGQQTLSVTENIQKLDSNIDSVATAAKEQTSVSRSIAESSQILHVSSQDQSREVGSSTQQVSALKDSIAHLNRELDKFDI